MKISFIRPNLSDRRSSDAMEPLVFALLAGRTPPEVERVLYDERVEPIPYDHPTDLVALTVDTFTARRAYQIAARFRARGVPVVMGGYHPTLLPEEAARFCDTVVIGDAEGVWETLVQDARRGKLQRLYRSLSFPALEGPQPDRSLFKGKRYAPLALVQYGRGCRFACDFCSIHAFYGNQLRQRPVAEVIAEITALERSLVVFVDDNIFSNITAAETLFRALIPLHIRWVCQVSLDITRNERLLALMARSGCIAVFVGFESLNERNLLQMNKKWNSRGSDYTTAIQKFHDHGIMIYGSFVFGYDTDTPATFERTVEFAIRSNFYLANFNPLTPMPATALYARLQSRMIYNNWWLDPDYRYGQALFHPQGMSADELTAGCFRARMAFYNYRSLLKRVLRPRNYAYKLYNLGIFLLSNLISRREILRKQNSRLGDDTPLDLVADIKAKG